MSGKEEGGGKEEEGGEGGGREEGPGDILTFQHPGDKREGGGERKLAREKEQTNNYFFKKKDAEMPSCNVVSHFFSKSYQEQCVMPQRLTATCRAPLNMVSHPNGPNLEIWIY